MRTDEQAAELRAVVNSRDVPAVMATWARTVLWTAEGRLRKDARELPGVSLPAADRWRIGTSGSGWPVWRSASRVAAGSRSGRRYGLILVLTHMTPPVKRGLSHWSSREMAR
ncbi:hypothetical protein GCM10010170_041860 [Dactylosporangium salmoneum]|uniref:SnoaL-like domain-containing protein n=1 Tax=Dactylosporangium salmoneum TaxID=53361 RepID=A0ABP5TJF3_9ACTN